jgi:hypothetical protein
MKALLICPAYRPAVPVFAAGGPLAITPILGDCAAGHWIEHLTSLGAREIEVLAPIGAARVRESLGDGARWGVQVKVTECNSEPTLLEATELHHCGGPGWLSTPYAVVSATHLPGTPDLPLFDGYAGWFEALIAWMPKALTPARVRVTEIRPGIWVGSRARVSPTAKLMAPCWIGDQVSVEGGAVVGPFAIIEDRSVVDSMARVAHSWVGPDTCVGPMTSVSNSIAWGSSLVDWRTDSTLHVPDPFLLSSLAKTGVKAATDRFGRPLTSAAPAGSTQRPVGPLRSRIGAADGNCPG